MYDELYSDSNISVLVPNYLDSDVLLTSSDETTEQQEEQNFDDSQENSVDYTSSLDDVNSSLDEISVQIDNLNDNIVTLNDNFLFGIGLLCALVLFSLIKFGWYILNNLLGLGKA